MNNFMSSIIKYPYNCYSNVYITRRTMYMTDAVENVSKIRTSGVSIGQNKLRLYIQFGNLYFLLSVYSSSNSQLLENILDLPGI